MTVLRDVMLLWMILVLISVGCGDDEDSGDDNGDDTESESGTEGAETQGAFESGEYHNYFGDLGYTQEEVDEKLAAAWESLFEGDPDTHRVYFEAGENDDGPLAYIYAVDSDDIRSEGMSYGMMFAVQFDEQEVFDALWNFAKTYMWHGDPEHPHYEYFAWHVNTDGSVISDTPAPDGEEYFAMALYFASGRWGDGEGIYDYRAAADRLVSAMKNREEITRMEERNGQQRPNTGVALFNSEHKMVRFSPSRGYFDVASDHTDPSYHLPAFYELWALWGPEEDSDFWREAAEVSRDYFELVAHEETGLTPDYAEYDGTPVPGWDSTHDSFAYDAQRTVMNWSVDWAWWRADPRARARSDKLLAFFDSVGPSYGTLFELDGTSTNHSASPGLMAMNAVAALSATDTALADSFVGTLWRIAVPNGDYRYYTGMLYMFAMLHVSGQFKIYDPTA